MREKYSKSFVFLIFALSFHSVSLGYITKLSAKTPSRVPVSQGILDNAETAAEALALWRKHGGPLAAYVGRVKVATAEDAREIIRAFDDPKILERGTLQTNWSGLAVLMNQVSTKEAYAVVAKEGVEKLFPLVVKEIKRGEKGKSFSLSAVSGLNTLAGFGGRREIGLIGYLFSEGYDPDNYFWSKILNTISRRNGAEAVLPGFAKKLPSGFATVALIDATNHLALAGKFKTNPFDTPHGRERLRRYVSTSDPRQASYAYSAGTTIAFLSEPDRSELLNLARKSKFDEVRLKAAWASAKLGQRSGVDELKSFAKNPIYTSRAQSFLTELNLVKEIPEEARKPSLINEALMRDWLTHPNEFGRQPDSLKLLKRMTLKWPSSNSRRTVWLYEYRYTKFIDNKKDYVGVGLVGARVPAFGLRFGTSSRYTPLENIAIHALWEQMQTPAMTYNEKEISVESGLKLLRKFNPDL